MKHSADEYNVLSYLLKKNAISYGKVIEWAYSQYTDEGVDPFVEKISLASDLSEIIEMISNEFQVYGEPGQKFLAGEAASKYSSEQISLYDAVARILFDLDLELPEEERQELYIAEDYFGWHNHAEEEAVKHVQPIFCKYRPIYEHAVAKFSV
ncbi:hypothetical protein HXX02_07900 [Microbulbifer elongatus]|uniref:DUF4375 domain-containing protein n=1 Tax=Microbulbifer elongatus TaxID=86173 RepID=A0ABT1P2X0_9GAMM|nr:hypothetical protein [Microbulbifer elongatus]MCQ3829366.1 hypothetical protein [Microbulbifer elongatus]